MSEPRYREWILDTIDSLRSRKARPDLERICRMVRRRHGSEPDRTCVELEKLIQEHAVLKVNYKGSVSYRNAAKVQRGRRKVEQASPGKSPAKRVCLADVRRDAGGGGDDAATLGPADEEAMEDGEVRERRDGVEGVEEDELSTTAGLDSSMDEEEASLDAPCMQNTTDSGIGLSPITDPGASLPATSPTPSKSSPNHSSLELERDPLHAPAEHTPPSSQQDTGSPELELARQPAAICPSAQRSALTGEEGPRVEENALTPDQLLSDCRASLHQDEAVGSDREPAQGSVPTEEGKNCSNEGNVASPQEIEQAKNGGGIKRADSVKSEEITQDPLLWSVSDVVSYFTAVGFPEQAVAFRTQEIDGKSLLLMQRSDVLTGLSIRLGPALKIYEHHVKVLQRSHFQDDSDVMS
ncbi:sterile alpha motif domain containing 1a isoform X2 [Astyanax mexicanus]|uniref:sterile alpha motif domain containing 1a isoform X2 n=1 Tax=Astyanax mexicanus TaxID=7994 RepID=UPI0020CAC14E|nr:sterile alpha motif domain containing 1a isoform X2 [Astyanax mexicanus]